MRKHKNVILAAILSLVFISCTDTVEKDSGNSSEPSKENQQTEYTVHFCCNEIANWDEVYVYSWDDSGSNAEWPGVKMSAAESGIYKAFVKHSNVIFTDGNGKQTVDLKTQNGYFTPTGTDSIGQVTGLWSATKPQNGSGEEEKPTKLETPIVTAMYDKSSKRIILVWPIVQDADSYEIYYNTTNNFNEEKTFEDTTETSYTTTEIKTNKITYYFWVRAKTEVEDNIAKFREYLEQETEPECKVGSQCSSPYDCGYWSHCAVDMPEDGEPTVWSISRLRDKQWYYDNGYITFQQLYDAGVLKGNYLQQVEVELKNLPPQIKPKEVSKFLETLSYPLYFLDFETFNPAIPLYDESSPYQQIVFQYSLHYIEKDGGELKHKECLAYPGTDPRRQIAEQLCKDIPLDVCTTAYNMGFEKGKIRDLAVLYPDLHDHLMNIHDNIKDIMIPFQKRWYYTKEMQGSYSIKYVLPALFPDDPSLNYHNLEGVHNGGEASNTFLAMQKMDKEELEKWREHLLRYCELDTFAMVKVLEKLREVGKC